jgi:hypothetical protein
MISRKLFLMMSVAAIGALAVAAPLGAVGTAVAEDVTGPSGWVNPLKQRFMSGKPLDVCDEGAFFVGGVPKITNFAASATAEGPPQQITIGQAYVQFQIPQKRHRWPIIMVHGSSQTGANMDATPDGHQGWLSYAVQNNFATFIMDQPGRGRSGFDASVLHEARVTGNLSLIPTMSRITDNGAWTSWFGHLTNGSSILDGTLIVHGAPGDPNPPEDPANPSEAHGNYPPAFALPPVPNSIDPHIASREGAIGPAPNPANNQYLALQFYKQEVANAEATLPGSVCPTCNPTTVAPSNTWSPRAMAELVEGLGGAIVIPHSQSTIQAMHMVRILKEHGKLNLLKGIIMPEGAAPIADSGLVPSDFDHIPFILINGDYRPLATPISGRLANKADVAAMNSSPTRDVGPAVYLNLDDPQFKGKFLGQTHMNMVGSTNLALFDFLMDWASTNIPNPIVETSCPGGQGVGNDQGGDNNGDNGQHKGQDKGKGPKN